MLLCQYLEESLNTIKPNKKLIQCKSINFLHYSLHVPNALTTCTGMQVLDITQLGFYNGYKGSFCISFANLSHLPFVGLM